MVLNRLIMNVRLRHSFEAMDLGVRLWQHFFFAFLKIWCVFTLPFIFSIIFIVYWFYPQMLWISALIIWWFKPLYDRLILHFFSHALFGEVLNLSKIFKSLFSLIFKTHLFYHLTIGRFSTQRSFLLAVWQLEGVNAKERKQRINLLSKKTKQAAFWLTMTCIHLELIIYFAFFGLIAFLIPEHYQSNISSFFFSWLIDEEQLKSGQLAIWIELVNILFLVLSISLIEPLYVTMGFMLYLKQRTLLEGWDIEINFRRLALRLQHSASIVLIAVFACFLTLSVSPTANATVESPTQTEIEDKIKAIKQQEIFKDTKESYVIVPNETGEIAEFDLDKFNLANFENFSFNLLIAEIIENILWVALSLILLILLFYYRRYLKFIFPIKEIKLTQNASHQATFTAIKNTHIEHPAQIAWQLWQAGCYEQAVGVLYFASRQILVEHYQLKLKENVTETECIQQLRKIQFLKNEVFEYFKKLTITWQLTAYALRLPSDRFMQTLCEEWQQHFSQLELSKQQEINDKEVLKH